MENEIWKDVPDYEGLYQVSNFGNIKRNGKYLVIYFRDSKPRCGYGFVTLHKNNIGKNTPIHQIVAWCFLDKKPFPKAEINHRDYNKKNNRADNLEWSSHLANMRHAFKNNDKLKKHIQEFGFRMRGKNNFLQEKNIHEIRNFIEQGMNDTDISHKYSVDRKTINNIRNGRNWGWLKTHSASAL